MIISLFETVRLSVSISLRNLSNSLNSIKEMEITVNIYIIMRLFISHLLGCLFLSWKTDQDRVQRILVKLEDFM